MVCTPDICINGMMWYCTAEGWTTKNETCTGGIICANGQDISTCPSADSAGGSPNPIILALGLVVGVIIAISI